MQITLNLQKLVEHRNKILKRPGGTLWTLKTSKIDQGYVAHGVYRHDLIFHSDDDNSETISFVQKFTGGNEVRVMLALQEMPEARTIPSTIDYALNMPSSDEKFANWFVAPFYEGSFLTFDDEIPLPIIETLARIHFHFAPRVEQFAYLHCVDELFFRRTFDNALASLEQAQHQKPDPIYVETYRHLKAASEARILYRTLETLPVTLTHGDVHPGNIIISPDGNSILFDWGNARVAPAMLDLANMVAIDSATWTHYLATWEAISGKELDIRIARLGYYWATIMVNTQYLPYAINYRPPENVQEMVGKVLNAVESISRIGPQT